MDIPENSIRKGIKRPDKAFSWLRRNIKSRLSERLDESIVTPLLGRYLFSYDWDLAIVLDACRYDLAKTRGVEHGVNLGEPSRAYSVGSWSPDWVRRTFSAATEPELTNTKYISANVFTNLVPEAASIDPVWERAWDADLNTVPPRPVTDATIQAMRDDERGRYIAHYMQPHMPPIVETKHKFTGFNPYEGQPWKNRSGDEWSDVASGEISPEAGKNAYRSNLPPVLDEVELLLNNVDAERVIITSDHGNYLGENGQWGHPGGHLHPAVRFVPWWTTTATDERTHTTEKISSDNKATRKEKLEALGYT